MMWLSARFVGSGRMRPGEEVRSVVTGGVGVEDAHIRFLLHTVHDGCSRDAEVGRWSPEICNTSR